MDSIYLDNLQLHSTTEELPYFIVQPIEGLEFPSIRTTMFNKSGDDGVYVSSQFLGERRITLSGYVRGATYNADRKALEAVCAPKKVSTELDAKTLTFTLEGIEYRIQVQCLDFKMKLENIDFGEFLIDLIAIDNSITSNALTEVTINTLELGGIIYPVVYPAVFEAGSGGTVTVNNAGNTPSYPVIRLNGQLTNPRIENRTTGKFVALTLELGLNEYIDIDMENKTIIQGGVTNKIGYKSSDSRFFSLAVGDNELVLTTSVAGEGGYATCSHRDAYIGV